MWKVQNLLFTRINRPDFSNVHINQAKNTPALRNNDVRTATGT